MSPRFCSGNKGILARYLAELVAKPKSLTQLEKLSDLCIGDNLLLIEKQQEYALNGRAGEILLDESAFFLRYSLALYKDGKLSGRVYTMQISDVNFNDAYSLFSILNKSMIERVFTPKKYLFEDFSDVYRIL